MVNARAEGDRDPLRGLDLRDTEGRQAAGDFAEDADAALVQVRGNGDQRGHHQYSKRPRDGSRQPASTQDDSRRERGEQDRPAVRLG